MVKILVTGGGGFIGSNLTETLLKRGYQVRVLDNFSTGKRENLIFDNTYSTLEIMEGDIRDLSVCQRAIRGMEYVFHQAALPSVPDSVEDPITYHAVNAGGTLNVLFAAKEARVQKFIFASSCAIYGDDPNLPKREDMPPHPASPYAFQKYIGEQYGRLFFQLYGLETISLRYFNVFGPKQDPTSVYSAVIPKFIEALLQEHSPVIFGDGEQSRDFIYVDDIIQANLLAMSAQHLHGEVVNVACGKRTSLNQLLNILKDILGSKISPIYQEPRKGDIRHSVADINQGKQFLNYIPKIEMEVGLKRTAEFFLKQRTVRKDQGSR